MSPTFANLLMVDLLHLASQCSERTFERHLRHIGLTVRQYAVLRAIAGSQNPSQTQIQTETGIDRSTAAEMIRRMARKGWLRRRRSAHDARAYRLGLTAEGERLLQSVSETAQRADQDIYAAIKSLQPSEIRGAIVELIESLEARLRQGT